MLGRQGPHRPFGLLTVLAVAGALAAAAAVTPAAASPIPAGARPAIGGVQLSGRGVLVNYPSRPPRCRRTSWGCCPGIPAERADRAQSVGSDPSVLAAAGFSCVALLAAGIGVAYRRRRSRS